MSDTLEDQVQAETLSQPSLRARMHAAWENRHAFAADYAMKWKAMGRDLIVPTILGATVAGLTKQYTENQGAGVFLQTVAPYAGYPISYGTYFMMHYYNNREKYPEGLRSRAYLKHIGHFLAADYVSDPVFASPVMLSASYFLGQNENIPAFVAGASAMTLGTLTWMSAMVIVQPTMEALSGKINNKIRQGYSAVGRTYHAIWTALRSKNTLK